MSTLDYTVISAVAYRLASICTRICRLMLLFMRGIWRYTKGAGREFLNILIVWSLIISRVL